MPSYNILKILALFKSKVLTCLEYKICYLCVSKRYISKNERGFQDITLNFKRINLAVFIGINGAGKSTILDCIAIMLAQFTAKLRNREADIELSENDIRLNSDSNINTIPCQLIVTTHSPQVLSEVRKENVFILEDYQIVEKTPYTYGRDSNSILIELMNVQERPLSVQTQIDNCLKLIENGHIEQAKLALNDLSNLLGENDSEVVRANTLIEFH